MYDSEGHAIGPFRISMVYAAPAWCPPVDSPDEGRDVLNEYYEEMHNKVLNVLRICHAQDHDDLILGAWGCCDYYGASARVMAGIFRKALLDTGSEASGVFRR